MRSTDVMQMANGILWVCGSRSTGGTDGLLARFDSSGQFPVERTYGGANGEEVFIRFSAPDACYIMPEPPHGACRGVDV